VHLPAHRTVTYREYYTRCCINTIWPPDDEHRAARNMYRIIIINVLYNVIVHQVGHLPRIYILCVRDVQTLSVTDDTLPAGLKHKPWRYTLRSFLQPPSSWEPGRRSVYTDSSTGWENRSSNTGGSTRCFSLPKGPPVVGPTQPPTEWIPEFFPEEKAAGE